MKLLLSIPILVIFSLYSFAQDTITHEKIFLATGEYDPVSNWGALLRFDTTENFNSESGGTPQLYAPEGTIPVKQCYDGGVMLNFAHGMYYQASHDRMYLSTLFTNQNNVLTTHSDTAVGSIAIFDSISSGSGGIAPSRHIFGDSTGIKQPHACWLDESRDMLYVANTFDKSILVFENASTANGNIAPDRTIRHDSLGGPVFIFIDEVVDRMFVTYVPVGPTPTNAEVAIYNNASTLDGKPDPVIRIVGSNTRLSLINPTVHNCWWNPNKQLLAVGHHTNELLMFDLQGAPWSATTTMKLDLSPRVIRVDDPALGHDSSDVNLYGLYWDLETDRMFCSVGVDNPGGGPAVGCPPEAIKIFSNVSDSTLSGIVYPDRVIYWDNCSTYYPPQPIWLHKTREIINAVPEKLTSEDITVFPNPAGNQINVKIKTSQERNTTLCLYNLLGTQVLKSIVSSNNTVMNTTELPPGIYFLKIRIAETVITKRVIKE